VKRLAIILLLLAGTVSAKYAPREMFVIGWGNGPDQLKIHIPTININETDTTDYDIDPGDGPSFGFIDIKDNVVVGSCNFNQLKVFSNSGELIYDILGNDTQIKRRIESESIDEIYIDSLSRIYLTTFPGLPIVPIIDYAGNIIDSLMPFGDSLHIQIVGLSWAHNGTLYFCEKTKGYCNLNQGIYRPGGTKAFLAHDGFYYSTLEIPPFIISFGKYTGPDSFGRPTTQEFKDISCSPDTIDYAIILNGGDGSRLFVYVIKRMNGQYNEEVRVYDLEYNLLDIASFPQYESRYDCHLDPFVTRDNSIYEFRCLEDGLHVIKWTKQ